MVNKKGEIVTYFKAGLKYWAKKMEGAAAASFSVAPPNEIPET